MDKFFPLAFPNGNTALSAQVKSASELPFMMQEMGLCGTRPTMVLVGGANGITEDVFSKLESLFSQVLAPLAESNRAFVVDGGTDSGVMRLMGQARCDTQALFPLVGVSAIGTIILPDDTPASDAVAPLEPHHTHFVLVPGNYWGDEVPWIAQVATLLVGNQPSFTVLVNGGKIAWQDVEESVKVGRPVVVIAGTGRTADAIAAALRGEVESERVKRLNVSGLLHIADVNDSPEQLRKTLETFMNCPAPAIHPMLT